MVQKLITVSSNKFYSYAFLSVGSLSMIKRFGLVVLIFFSSISQAKIMPNGNVFMIENGFELQYACQGLVNEFVHKSKLDTDQHNSGKCLDFFYTVKATHSIYKKSLTNYKDLNISYCFDKKGLTSEVFFQNILDYLEQNPKIMAESGALALTLALKNQFPCPKS